MDLRLIGSPLPIHVHDFGWLAISLGYFLELHPRPDRLLPRRP